MSSEWPLLVISPNFALAADRPVLAVIDFFPFGYRDKDGSEKGMFFDFAAEIGKRTGQEIDARLMPVPRALRDASRGDVDMLISYKDPVMVPNVHFVGNVGCLTAYIIPGKGTGIKSIEDLGGQRIGAIGSGYFEKRFRGKIPYMEVRVPTNQAMLKMLVRGRLEGFVINSAVYDAFYYFGSPVELPPGWREQVDAPIPIETLETHLSIAASSAFAENADYYSAAIASLGDEGVLAEIFSNYGSQDRGSCN